MSRRTPLPPGKQSAYGGTSLYWFGEPWKASVCQNLKRHVPVPLGAFCGDCQKPLTASSQGVIARCTYKDGSDWIFVPFHLECFAAGYADEDTY